MEKPDGTPIPSSKTTEEWNNYFSTLLGGAHHLNNKAVHPLPADKPLPINIVLYTSTEITTALAQAKTGKAAGLDHLTVEVLNHGNQEIQIAILDICNLVYQLKTSPHQWNETTIIPIYKKGSKSLLSNYRGISLMSVGAKLFNRVLLNRIRPVVNPLLLDNQAGFRPDRSCTDQVHILR